MVAAHGRSATRTRSSSPARITCCATRPSRRAAGKACARGYHGEFDDAEGASYLYWVGDETDATPSRTISSRHPGAIDLWLGGHTHTHPDDRFGNKSHIEQRWGVTFANVAAMTRHHGQHKRPLFPLSRLLTFERGSREVRIQCYLHTTDYAAQGWYAPAERTAQLRTAFRA